MGSATRQLRKAVYRYKNGKPGIMPAQTVCTPKPRSNPKTRRRVNRDSGTNAYVGLRELQRTGKNAKTLRAEAWKRMVQRTVGLHG